MLELLARERVVQVERRTAITVGELLDAEFHVRLGRKLDLRPLCSGTQPLVRLSVLACVVAILFEELRSHVVCDGDVDIIATEERVARSCEHLEHVAGQLQDRDVEGTAAEVVHRNALGRSLVVAVGERRGRRLVEDAQHVEASNASGCLGRTSLKLVEVGGHRHDRLATLLADRLLGDLSDVPKHERADLAQRVGLSTSGDQHASTRTFRQLERESLLGLLDLVAGVGPADEPLDRVDRVLRIEQTPLFGGSANQDVTTRMK